ncbi:hypothetical protein LCGC14_1274900, partial [marine sediment metagenome]
MPEIDEISVKMSLTTEDFVKEVDKAITDSLHRAEEFEARIGELGDAMRTLGQGAGLDFLDKAGKASIQDISDSFEAFAEFTTRLEKDERAFRDILTVISDEFITNITGMAEAAGTIIPKDIAESLDELVRTETLASESTEDLTRRLRLLTADVMKAAIAVRPASQEFKRVSEVLENLGAIVPIKKMERFRESLIEENKAANEAGESILKVDQRMRSMGNAFLEAQTKGIRPATGLLEQFKGTLNGMLGKLAVGVIALKALSSVYQTVNRFIRESIQVATQAAIQQQQLAIAVLEHARAVGELSPSLAEANAFAEELAKTYNRTQLEMREVVRQSLFLTRSLKMSRDETERLAESAIVMSKAHGVDALSTLRTFTNFLNTGYTQGLQRLGISLDKNQIEIEAVRRGYVELGEELDKQTFRMIGMELITEQVTEVAKDLVGTQNEFIEAIDEANATIEEQKEIIGDQLLPVTAAWKLTLADLAEWFGSVFSTAFIGVLGEIMNSFATIEARIKTLGRLINDPALITKIGEIFEEEKALAIEKRIGSQIDEGVVRGTSPDRLDLIGTA